VKVCGSDVLPRASVAVQVTVVVPIAKSVPDAWAQFVIASPPAESVPVTSKLAVPPCGEVAFATTDSGSVRVGAVVQLEDLLDVVTSWHIPGHLIEIRTKGPHWALTQTPPRVNLACQQIRDFETALGGSLGAPLTPDRLAWLSGELGRIYNVIGCPPVTS